MLCLILIRPKKNNNNTNNKKKKKNYIPAFWGCVLITSYEPTSIFSVGFWGTLTKPSGRRRSPAHDNPTTVALTKYDEYGRVPQLESAKKAVDRGRSILVLSLEAGIVVAVMQHLVSGESEGLVDYLGSSPLSSIDIFRQNSTKYILMTGLIGDANYLGRISREIEVNSSFEMSGTAFDNSCPLPIFARRIASFQQQSLFRGERPIAVHSFLIDSINSLICEIDSAGNVKEIFAGAAGADSELAISVLEKEYCWSMSIENARNMIKRIYDNQMKKISADGLNSKALMRLYVTDPINKKTWREIV